MTTAVDRLHIEVVKGDPSDEELAAVVVAMLAVTGGAGSGTAGSACCERGSWKTDARGAQAWTVGSPWARSLPRR